MTDPEDLVQIGDFAKLAGTNLRTLRYYEELGLLRPASRSDGGFRFYERGQLDRLAAIKRLQDLGLSLKEIASAIVSDPAACRGHMAERLRPAIDKQIELTEATVQRLRGELDELREAQRRLIEMCQGCEYALSRDHCDPCVRDHKPLPAVLRALLD